MKIIKYQIARACSTDTLELQVHNMIMNGWQPYGELKICVYNQLEHHAAQITLYVQTMVMYAPEEGICEHEFVPVGSIKNGVQHAECRKCKFRP